ncbi:UNVERIFIED_CONTAM: hypothetical protein Slati_2378600 [Sesamum latifolium]|uniref:Endonuclease/exonuclease/phosphatase domain-containing protein n=1 Tax=Sesamum latifolium TaxID=2727402 RepID=A0AAW2WGA9_9LAMI
MCAGDFNEILDQQEKDCFLPRPPCQIREFREYLNDCGLQDLGFAGNIFTWCNHREEPNTVRARLDCAYCDSSWAELFPMAKVTHVPVACSYREVLWIALDGKPSQYMARRKQRFRFEVAWASSPACVDVIQQAWLSDKDNIPHRSLIDKIRACRMNLLQWNRSSFGNIRKKLKELNEKICERQAHTITPSVKFEIETLKDSLERMAASEEIL